jgi:aryl-alcohol dehydrogenase-like predicted oxidoreductase
MKNLEKELILGTANFSHLYRKAQNKEFSAVEILVTAFENGITTLDISNSYVDAYKFVADSNLSWNINAKIVLPEHITQLDNEIRLKVIDIFEQIPRIKICSLMIHNITDVSSFSINDVSTALRKVAGEFDIKKIGISLYPEQISKISAENFDVIQIPVNVLDQRVFKENILQSFLQQHTQVQARSIYLRGLLTTALEPFKSKDRVNADSVTLFKEWCQAKNLNTSFVCMNFVYHLNFITNIVFGANNVNELKENIDCFKKSKAAKIKIPYKNFESTNLELIDPRYWDT